MYSIIWRDDEDNLFSTSDLATKFNVWAAHLSCSGNSYSTWVQSSSISNVNASHISSKVASSSCNWSSSSRYSITSSDAAVGVGSTVKILNTFTKFDPLSVVVAETFGQISYWRWIDYLASYMLRPISLEQEIAGSVGELCELSF